MAGKSAAFTRDPAVLEAWTRRRWRTERTAWSPLSGVGRGSWHGCRRAAEARHLARVDLAGLTHYGRGTAHARAEYCAAACTDHAQRIALRLPRLRRRTDTAANVATGRGVYSDVPDSSESDSTGL